MGKIYKQNTKKNLLCGNNGFKILKAIMFGVFLLYALSLLFPIFFALLASMRDADAYSKNSFSLIGFIGFKNYLSAFKYLPMKTSTGKSLTLANLIINSSWYTIGGTGLAIIASSLTSYIVAKYKFKGRNLIYAIAVFTLTLPIIGQIPSQFKVYDMLHIRNSPLIILSFFNGFGFNFLVLYACFKNISWTYAEAAFIDGAGHFKVFVKIMLPQAAAIIGALFIITCVNYWNDYLGPILFLPDWPTLASGLYEYRVYSIRDTNMGGVNTPVMFAGMLVSIAPVVACYIAFNKSILNISFAGGIKG